MMTLLDYRTDPYGIEMAFHEGQPTSMHDTKAIRLLRSSSCTC